MSADPSLLALLAALLLIAAIGLFLSTLGEDAQDERAPRPPEPRDRDPSVVPAPRAPPAPGPSHPLRLTLSRAGFDGRRDGGWYFAVKVGLAAVGGLAVFGAIGPFVFPGEGRLLLALLAATVGFVFPSGLLRLVGQNRMSSLRAELPDLLDFVVTGLEAGQGLEEAMQRAALELGRYGSPLARELETTIEHWADGRSRIAAIEELRLRTGVDSIGEFLEAIEEARRDGTTITQALAAQAEALRQAEAARAEEWARKIPLLVAVNLAIFMLPAAFVGVLGSSIVQAVRLLMPNLP